MAVFWIDTKTGELLPDWKEGAQEFEMPREEVEGRPDDQWLRAWYLREMRRLSVAVSDTKAQGKKMVASLETEIKGLKWRWQERFQALVEADLANQKGRKKSVIYFEGTAGWFKNTSVEVYDPEACIAWLKENVPDALNYKEPTVIKAILPKGEDVPGVKWPEGDRFFVRFPKRKGEE